MTDYPYDGLPAPSFPLPAPVPKDPAPTSVWRELGALGLKIAVAAVAGLLAIVFVFGLYYSTEPGMNPAVQEGDLVVYYRQNRRCRAGDLVLLRFEGQTQVRRVIAAAGDTVDITEKGLLINGAIQQERKIYRKTERYADGIDFPLTIAEGELFVLGDAREGVTDSRIYGPVRIKDTYGTVIAVLRRRNL